MTILEQAEELRKQAIALLISERDTINERLAQLGHNGEPIQRAAKKCSICSACGHTARTCKKSPPVTAGA